MPGAEKNTYTYEDPTFGTVTNTIITNGQVTNIQSNASGGDTQGRAHENSANTDGASHTVYQSSMDGANPAFGDFEQDIRFISSGNENQSHFVEHFGFEAAGTDYDAHTARNDQGYNLVVMVDDAHPLHENTIGNGFDLFA